MSSNIKGVAGYKYFDRELHAHFDQVARRAVKYHLQHESGLYVVDNKDIYGPDLVVYQGLRPSSYVEVEVKRVWKAGSEFPWTSVQVPLRKWKFLEVGMPIEFWVLRADLREAIVVTGEALGNAPIREISNSYLSEGEYFHCVPLTTCSHVTIRKD